MNPILLRLFLPVLAGVLLGIFFALRAFLRARADAEAIPDSYSPKIFEPERPSAIGPAITTLAPITKVLYAAVLAFATAGALAADAPATRANPALVYFVCGSAMGLVAVVQGLVAAARMKTMFGPQSARAADAAGALLEISSSLTALPVSDSAKRQPAFLFTWIIQGVFETPAIVALIGGLVFLQSSPVAH
jgi:hypothetical protein